MNLIRRVKNILLTPKSEWKVINGESFNGLRLIFTYLLPVTVVASLVGFIGYGIRNGGLVYGLLGGLFPALETLIEMILATYVGAIVTNALAPSFNSEKNMGKSIQLVVYAATPIYLIPIVQLLTIIPLLGLAGSSACIIYSIYLLYTGLATLKKTPKDKVMGYLILIVLILALANWLVKILVGILFIL